MRNAAIAKEDHHNSLKEKRIRERALAKNEKYNILTEMYGEKGGNHDFQEIGEDFMRRYKGDFEDKELIETFT